jgi:hypothetical protein
MKNWDDFYFLFPLVMNALFSKVKMSIARDKKIKDIELMSWTPVINEINTIIGRFLGTNVGKKSN